MQSRRIAIVLGMLAVIIAVGLLSGPAGFGPDGPNAEAALLSEVKKLLASDAEADDTLGFSVAISGDTAVVGAIREDAEGSPLDNFGAAYVFQRDQGGAGNWGEVKKLTASEPQSLDHFGSSVAVSGDTAVVGAPVLAVPEAGAGAAYVFQRDQGGAGNWGEVKKLTASDAQALDRFGFSVAVSGDTVLVGADLEDAGGGPFDNFGAAYVFERDEGGTGNWGNVKKLLASDAQVSDGFGFSVAVSGDTALVGGNGEDAGGDSAGAAYVFERDEGGTGNWGEVRKLLASDAQAGDQFGNVAISGNTAIVGAHREDAGGNLAGAAYVFQRDEGGTGNWGEVKKLLASDAQADNRFGYSVAVSGDTALVGARQHFLRGAAYVFGRDEGGTGNWGEVSKLTASDSQGGDELGWSVAVSGDTALVGAPNQHAEGSRAGAGYVFDLLLPKPPPPTPGPCLDFDGDTLCEDVDPDDDNDGCTDLAEQQPNSEAATGGGRDPLSYWDFMDMWVNKQKDRRVNMIDIGAIVNRFGSSGDPGGDPLDPPQALTGYHVSADRSPPALEANLWNAGPPDGLINIIEVGAVVIQFGHDCSGS